MADIKQPKPTLMGELREIKALMEDTNTSLRSQRDILKTRGMNLPPIVMQSLGALNSDIASLETAILGEQTELAQLRSMAQMSAMINSSLNVDEVLNHTMDVVISLTNAERGYIILADPKTGGLVFRVARESELLPRQGGAPQISQTILKEVLETGEPLLADNAYKDERLQSGQSIAAMTLRSVLCVPLKYKDDIIGVVYVDNRLRSGVFTETSKNLLAAFANQAAVAIENAHLYSEIQRSLEQIREIKELMDNVLASIGSGVITTNEEHRVLTFNRAAASILEREEEQTLGQPLGAILPGVTADLDNYLDRVSEQDAAQTMDAEMEVPSRGRIALSMKLSPLKDAGRSIQGVAMVLDDLTEQRQREETLNLVKRYLPPEMVDMIHEIAQLALGGERREVTCMFVDMRHVSTLPVGIRPKEIMEMLNTFFGQATQCINNAKGVIDEYMGTEIMVLFNTQLNPMEDHALKAVQCALDIRDTILELYKKLGINPEPGYYRMGIHTGVATLGNVGGLNRREFSAIGNTINMSKRFEENAKLGQIIISPDSHAFLNKIMSGKPLPFRLETREPVRLKGIENPVNIYEVFRS